jgi:hypothetical protein
MQSTLYTGVHHEYESSILPHIPYIYMRTSWIWPFHSACSTLYTGVHHEYETSIVRKVHYIQAYIMSMNLPYCLIYHVYRRTSWVWIFHIPSYTIYTGVLHEYDPSIVRKGTIYRHTLWVWNFHSTQSTLYKGDCNEYDPSIVRKLHNIQAYFLSMNLLCWRLYHIYRRTSWEWSFHST